MLSYIPKLLVSMLKDNPPLQISKNVKGDAGYNFKYLKFSSSSGKFIKESDICLKKLKEI